MLERYDDFNEKKEINPIGSKYGKDRVVKQVTIQNSCKRKKARNNNDQTITFNSKANVDRHSINQELKKDRIFFRLAKNVVKKDERIIPAPKCNIQSGYYKDTIEIILLHFIPKAKI